MTYPAEVTRPIPPEAIGDPEAVGEAAIRFLDEHPLGGTNDIPPAATDEPVVCIAHGRFIPCRKDGEHRYTSNPYWVKAVRDYQNSPIEDLTWEPAWEGNDGEA